MNRLPAAAVALSLAFAGYSFAQSAQERRDALRAKQASGATTAPGADSSSTAKAPTAPAAPAAWTGRKVEYRVVEAGVSSRADTEKFLNALGRDGWTVVNRIDGYWILIRAASES